MRRDRNSALRVIVLGYVVRGPLGGMVASNLQYLIGLMRLGHDVYFVEDSDDYVSCYDPSIDDMTTDPTYGLGFAGRSFDRIGLGGNWAYHDAHTSRWLGPAADRIPSVISSADLVLNLCGVNPLRPWLLEVPARILVDEDPGFTQIRHLTDPAARATAALHTAFFSFAENIGGPLSKVPDDGFSWGPTRQPVVADSWPVAPPKPEGKFTTLMQWESYSTPVFAGVRYGQKRESFRPYLDLPRHTGPVLELAISRLPTSDRKLLIANGWSLTDQTVPSRDPCAYQRFVHDSKAEFSVAKEGYVVSRCGWFSERSACYLATGRPVVVQDTGFTRWLNSDRGLLAFRSPEEAAAGVEEVISHYPLHCRAAREVAESFFNAETILASLLERSMDPRKDPSDGAACRSEVTPSYPFTVPGSQEYNT